MSAFISADIPKITALKPDLVLTFSDLQADIVATLVREGIAVHAFNQRTVDEILDMIRTLGSLVDASARANKLADGLTATLERVRAQSAARPDHPKVYFEEWDEPMISGIAWVSELIGLAGGADIFPERAACPLARERIIADGAEVVARQPDIILGSWCGKRFRPAAVAARAGWQDIPAVRDGELHEVKSPLILQPGPAALTDGVDAMQRIFSHWAQRVH